MEVSVKSRKKTAEAVILFSHCYSADRLFQLDIVNSSNAQQVCPGGGGWGWGPAREPVRGRRFGC